MHFFFHSCPLGFHSSPLCFLRKGNGMPPHPPREKAGGCGGKVGAAVRIFSFQTHPRRLCFQKAGETVVTKQSQTKPGGVRGNNLSLRTLRLLLHVGQDPTGPKENSGAMEKIADNSFADARCWLSEKLSRTLLPRTAHRSFAPAPQKKRRGCMQWFRK